MRMRLVILATLFSAVMAVLATAVTAAPLALKRGVGVHDWLNWSPLAEDGSYRWPPYRSVEEWLGGARPLEDWPAGNPFGRIRELGFDFIRLSVDPGPLLASRGAERQEALSVLEAGVRQASEQGLMVVFNLHGVSQVPAYGMDVVNGPADSPLVADYIEMTTEVAAMLVEVGIDRVVFEPYNEPAHYPCDASGSEDWQQIISRTVAAVRAVSAELSLVVTGGCGGSITGLTDIRPDFDDPNIYYSFHMYEPHSFTHQRVDDAAGFASGLPWPASAGTPDAVIAELRARMTIAGLSEGEQVRQLGVVISAIDEYFAEGWDRARFEARVGEAIAWAKDNGIPTSRLFMGEFGVILMSADGRMGANDADRLRYLAAARETAEAHDIPWSVWEYSNPYGMTVIVPEGPAEPDLPMLQALGLGQ